MKSKVVRGWGLEMASAADRLAVARDYVRQHAPYFSKILYGLTFIPVPGIGTMSTTRNLVCGYDPEYVKANEPEVIASDIAHEIMHVLHRHFERLDGCQDQNLANIAADLPINVDLRNATDKGKPTWRLHPTFVFPENLGLPDGKTAEQYYELLLREKAAGNIGTNGQQKKPGGSAAGKGSPSSSSEGEPHQGRVGCGHCGGVAGQNDHPALAKEDGRSEVERTAIVMQVGKAMREHAAQHGRGSLPGSLVEWLDTMGQHSKRDWRRHLGSILRNCSGRIQSGGDDYSLSRPSRRSYLRGMIRPGLIENVPIVAFVLDTSGSMGKEQLISAAVESSGVLQALGIDEVWFAEADADVAMSFQLVSANYFRKLKIAGRGGTDFRPSFAAVRKLKPTPDLLIYFTDGDGRTPRYPPRAMEVVWCIVPSRYNRRPAHWGHTILVTDDPHAKLHEPILEEDDGAQQIQAP